MADPIRMVTGPDTPLGQARQFVRINRTDTRGAVCPCCGSRRVVKRYRMSDKVAFTLARLVKKYWEAEEEPVHRTEWCPLSSQGHHSAILRFYRLIMQPTGDTNKPYNRSGLWVPTDMAVSWLNGVVTIRSYVCVEDGQRIGQSSRRITFEDATGVPYDPESPYDPPGG